MLGHDPAETCRTGLSNFRSDESSPSSSSSSVPFASSGLRLGSVNRPTARSAAASALCRKQHRPHPQDAAALHPICTVPWNQTRQDSLRPFCCNLQAASSNATEFQSCNNCSLLQQLLLPAMAASRPMRSSAHLRRANQAHCAAISKRRATRKLLANAPITIRQLRDCVHVAVSMAASFFEDSNQSLARVQAQTLPVHRHR